MRNLKATLIFLSSLVLLSSCGDYKKFSMGRDERIITLCDEGTWNIIEDTLRSAVEYKVRTPQEEKIFFFDRVNTKDFSNYKYNKNICLITSLDQNDKTSAFVRQLISPTALQFIENDREYMFTISDHWARRQLMMIIAAPTREKLKDFIIKNRDRIYLAIDKSFIDNQMDQLYYKAEETELENELMDKYGFSLRIPNDYKIVMKDPSRHVIQLGKANPYRWITIYWREGGIQSLLNKEWAWSTRSWMANQIVEDTYIEKQYVTTRNMYWDDLFVNNLRGLWAHKTKTMGGPFSVFYFYDGISNRIFFIDLSLWAPGEYKNVYLRQMELVASTFSSRPPVDKSASSKTKN